MAGMDFLTKSKMIEIIRVFILGGMMLFLSSRIQILWLFFLILLIVAWMTGQFKYIDGHPTDKISFRNYQLYNFGFFFLLLLVFGYRYFATFSDKPVVERVYWPVYVGTYLFNLKVVRKEL